tara:strand:- start:2465 stop:3025 length:561 start_codon:yes stop_codon:yes gene_type:complete
MAKTKKAVLRQRSARELDLALEAEADAKKLKKRLRMEARHATDETADELAASLNINFSSGSSPTRTSLASRILASKKESKEAVTKGGNKKAKVPKVKLPSIYTVRPSIKKNKPNRVRKPTKSDKKMARKRAKMGKMVSVLPHTRNPSVVPSATCARLVTACSHSSVHTVAFCSRLVAVALPCQDMS